MIDATMKGTWRDRYIQVGAWLIVLGALAFSAAPIFI